MPTTRSARSPATTPSASIRDRCWRRSLGCGGGLDVGSFVRRAVTEDVDGVAVRYLALDDLIAMRRAVSRPKDRRRAAELEAIARSRTG